MIAVSQRTRKPEDSGVHRSAYRAVADGKQDRRGDEKSGLSTVGWLLLGGGGRVVVLVKRWDGRTRHLFTGGPGESFLF